MAIFCYDYGDTGDFCGNHPVDLCGEHRFVYNHDDLRPAGKNAAQQNRYSWRRYTFGKQFKHKEQTFLDDILAQGFQGYNEGLDRHISQDWKDVRIDPAAAPVAAGTRTRSHGRHWDKRIPGDSWQNTIGRDPKQDQMHRKTVFDSTGKHANIACIDALPKKAPGGCCAYLTEPNDLITHLDESSNWKYAEHARIKRSAPVQENPWSMEHRMKPYETEPASKTKIAGLPQRVLLKIDGTRELKIHGNEDLLDHDVRTLKQDMQPTREGVKANDKKYSGRCHYQAMWDILDGTQPTMEVKPHADSKQVRNLIDNRDNEELVFDLGPNKLARSTSMRVREETRRVAQARSARGAAGNWHNNGQKRERSRFERRDSNLRKRGIPEAGTSTPWAGCDDYYNYYPQRDRRTVPSEVSEIAPSDSISQVSKSRSRRSQSTRGSRSSRDMRQELRQQDADVYDGTGQNKLTQRPDKESFMRRSQSARLEGTRPPLSGIDRPKSARRSSRDISRSQSGYDRPRSSRELPRSPQYLRLIESSRSSPLQGDRVEIK